VSSSALRQPVRWCGGSASRQAVVGSRAKPWQGLPTAGMLAPHPTTRQRVGLPAWTRRASGHRPTATKLAAAVAATCLFARYHLPEHARAASAALMTE
jgi:hypothetical protein